MGTVRNISYLVLYISYLHLTLLLEPSIAMTRQYYVMAVEEEWDYAPGGKDNFAYQPDTNSTLSQESDWKVFLQQGPQRIGSRYKKAMYREFTDGNFTERTPREEKMGFLGPLLSGEQGDIIRVVFRNMAGRNYSMHPHGVQYVKSSEGALYQDGTSGADKADDGVPPGQEHIYEWQVTDKGSPTKDDPDCLTWAYHSHVDPFRDTSSGLIGILLTCKPGTLDTIKAKYTQIALLFTVMDENKSWYIEENVQTYCTQSSTVNLEDDDFQESNLMHGINGRVYGHLTGLTACVGSTIMWHLVGFGNEVDLHSVSISGHSFLTDNTRQDAIGLNPVDFVTATTLLQVAGNWSIMCNIHDHVKAGMVALLHAERCPASAKNLPKVVFRQYRRYYIAINEVDWNYAPSGRNLFEDSNLTEPGSASEVFFLKDKTHIGGTYKKAIYQEYEDITFSRIKRRKQEEIHLGFLGPILRAEVGFVMRLTLRNNAKQPFSIHPHGALLLKEFEGSLYSDGNTDKEKYFVEPGQTRTTYWFIQEEMGPGPLDPPCITRIYTSSTLDVVRDTSSGLVGPILVCRSGSLANLNSEYEKQKQIDIEFFLMFGIIDENKSWYIGDNAKSLVGVDFDDEEFQESNLMHGINGYMYGNLPGLNMCQGDRVAWHVFSVGSEKDVHSVYFYGQSLTIMDTHRSSTALLPGYFNTLYMETDNPGEWAVVCRTNYHYNSGTKALFNVSRCNLHRDFNLRPSAPHNRTYYLMAQESYWDYAPTGLDITSGRNLSDPNHPGHIYIRSDGPFLGSRYKKVRYHQYTDGTFTTEVTRSSDQEYLGILGPLIMAEVFDTITVVFRNNASRPYSIHAQGLYYDKESEGAAYGSSHNQLNSSGVAQPGQTIRYSWSVPIHFAPGEGDPPCINQAYYSAVDPAKDPNSGLIGPLVLCKPGVLNPEGTQRQDVSKSFALLFEIFDENDSWYLEENIQLFGQNNSAENPDFTESNLFHSINGFLYGNLPPLNITTNSSVDWHLMTLGNQEDIHAVHFHGNDVRKFENGQHARDVMQLFPGIFSTVSMNASNPGQWLLHCHVDDHMEAGMLTTYNVLDPVIKKNQLSFGDVEANK